jgi:hypothetical protein
MQHRSPVRPAFALTALALTLVIGACSDEDSPTDPTTTPTPSASIRIDVSPDSTLFTGSLSGPDGFQAITRGDTVLTDLTIGHYLMTWPPVEGYTAPYPPSQILSAVDGDTITFEGVYTLIPVPPDPVEILILGNSYTFYNDMPDLFRGLCEADDREVYVDWIAPGGWSLRDHLFDAVSISRIYSRDWDHVVLQGSGGRTGYPSLSPFDPVWAVDTLEDRIHANHAETEIVFTMPWGYEDGFHESGFNDDYFAMQQRIYDNTLTYPDEVDLVLSPVGWAWNAVMLEEPEVHFLFHTDWYHPSLRGSYLYACVLYASIFRTTVVGNDFRGGLNAVDAIHLQSVASLIVLEDLALWRLGE